MERPYWHHQSNKEELTRPGHPALVEAGLLERDGGVEAAVAHHALPCKTNNNQAEATKE